MDAEQQLVYKFLAAAPPFASLPAAEREALARSLHRRSFQPREVVFSEGDRAAHSWLVCSGRVRIVVQSSGARLMQLEILEQGQIFGLFCRLGGERGVYRCTAIADGPVTALRVPDSVFDELLRRYPVLGREAGLLCAARLSVMQMLACLGRETAEFRVAEVLHRAFIGQGAKVRLTRQDIAVRIGTTVETVFRVLAGLRRHGWINTARGSILIKDPAAIAAYVRRRKGR